jgi:hypothetical protein
MARKFSSAGERISIYEDDFEGVCQILAGASRWRPYIAPNLAAALKAFGTRVFQIVSAEDFVRNYALEAEDMGFTNKIRSQLVLKEIFKGGRETVMVSALHEMVHWVSHPAEQGKQVTVMGFLGRGLMEGLTHVVTEDLLQDQGITQYSKPIYAERVAIVRKLIERFKVELFGPALFQGHVNRLKPLLDTYGSAGFREISELATKKDDKKAIACIDRLNRANDARKKAGAAGGR